MEKIFNFGGLLSILWFVDPTTLINKNFYCHFYWKGVCKKGGIYIGLSFLIPKTGLYDTHDIDLFSYYLKMISGPARAIFFFLPKI